MPEILRAAKAFLLRQQRIAFFPGFFLSQSVSGKLTAFRVPGAFFAVKSFFSLCFFRLVNILLRRKSGYFVKMCRKHLCKPKCIHSVEIPCGKRLWKSLWIMWKSYGFQQVFSPFLFSPTGGHGCICRCIQTASFSCFRVMLPLPGRRIFSGF